VQATLLLGFAYIWYFLVQTEGKVSHFEPLPDLKTVPRYWVIGS